jgi:hypothetical protein
MTTTQIRTAPLVTLSNENISRRPIGGFDLRAWLVRGPGTADAHGYERHEADTSYCEQRREANSAAVPLGGRYHLHRSRQDEAYDLPGRHNRQFVRPGVVAAHSFANGGDCQREPAFFQTHNTGVSPTRDPTSRAVVPSFPPRGCFSLQNRAGRGMTCRLQRAAF